ncbi:HlyD family secretion protein [Desulfobulbus elongatus]|uniref:HlyD family secretion protein n=1 Tax=Desulfobulbus elongatus TaxID=53332 RepID=UPI000483E540|nr:HlyD family secretion protein [Desulfobulbus elongatus]
MNTSQSALNNEQNWIGRHRRLLLYGVPLLLAGAGLVLYLTGGRYVSTDDAYIRAARVAVSADISGRISEIPLAENQQVRTGDVLVRIDARPFAIAEQEASAQLEGARLQVVAMKANYRQKLADLRAAESTLAYQERDYSRQKKLAESGISSQAQLEKAEQLAQTARQEAVARRQEADTALANLGGNAEIQVDDHPSVQAAHAKLDQARLNLSYTTVAAPMDGIVTKVEQLQVGDYITKGAALFALVSATNRWVEANFKETALAHMRPGQKASILVDAHADRSLSGTVVSLSPGTGSSFSLLPPENATGNWVKIVQRVPVRIELDKDAGNLALQSGLSVTAEVDTGHSRLGLSR